MKLRHVFWVPAVLGLVADLLSKHLIFACLSVSPLLRVEEVWDWPGFSARLRDHAAAGQPGLPRVLWELLPQSVQGTLRDAAAGRPPSPQQRDEAVQAINGALRNRSLATTTGLPESAVPRTALVGSDPRDLSEEQVLRLNRLLLEAWFPQELQGIAHARLAGDPFLRNRYPVVAPWLVIQLERNTGGVFGMLRGKGYLFVGLSVLALGVVLWMLRNTKPEQRLMPAALGLVVAGAIGNLVDRLAFGYVRDFIYVEIINWPAFNVADMCICVAAGLLALELLRAELRERKERKGKGGERG
jgi:signal peptidase II